MNILDKVGGEALVALIRAACFHYFHCGADDDCGKVKSSMAALAIAIGFDQQSVEGDEIRSALQQAAGAKDDRT